MARSAELKGMELQGRPVLLAVAPVEGTGWMLAIALDKAEALSAIGTMLQVSVLTGLVVLVVAGTVRAGILAQRLRRLTQVRDAMRKIGSGEGDLSRRIDAHGEDELAQIAEGFNSFASKLAGVLVQIRDASGSVRVAAEEIATGNQDLSSRTELTASSLEETTASMQQLTETVRHNADAARQANQMVAQASTVAQRGGQVVGDVVRTMDQINAASRKIEDIIQVIEGIASVEDIDRFKTVPEAYDLPRRRGSRTCRRAGAWLCRGGQRGASAGRAQRRGGQGDQAAHWHLGGAGFQRLAPRQRCGHHHV